ncbi:MAG: DrmB family protein [Gammaproteobacteria bacterium]
MIARAHGQVRRSQIITTWGPGALLDLPRHAVIMGGLETWPRTSDLEEIPEPRLAHKLETMTRVIAPRLYAPPPDSNDPRESKKGIGVYQFPKWFVVQEESTGEDRQRSRRLAHLKALDDRGKLDGCPVVPTRFVRACPKGHVDDLDWHRFVHESEDTCRRQLWLDERGTGGDLADLVVRCECKKSRSMHEATAIELNPLGTCSGARPWLGSHSHEGCDQRSRLLIRTASNAYFPQVLSVLSLPDRGSAVQTVVAELWDDLQIVNDKAGLDFIRQKPRVAEALAPFDDEEILEAIRQRREGSAIERPVKQVELDAVLAAPEGFGDETPIDPTFHARRLPERAWRRSSRTEGIEAVIQLHRLREVLALAGFTRLEAATPDIHGEYESDVERAELALEPRWFPAVENRGEGVFLQLRADSVRRWLDRPQVKERVRGLANGYLRWLGSRRIKSERPFPGGPYVLLHTLSHLLIQSLAMRCGYPASSIRERIYVDPESERFGLLLYTGSPDAEGTLGGLVQQGRHIETHLIQALHTAALCSNDPICAHHAPGESLEERWLHGAACHGCALIAETSCEMRNDFLDRALVVPILGLTEAAFFDAVV